MIMTESSMLRTAARGHPTLVELRSRVPLPEQRQLGDDVERLMYHLSPNSPKKIRAPTLDFFQKMVTATKQVAVGPCRCNSKSFHKGRPASQCTISAAFCEELGG